MSYHIPGNLEGLTEDALKASRERYGFNRVGNDKQNTARDLLLDILKEPMFVLLIVISLIYFIISDYAEAVFMLLAVIAVSGISFYQDNRSKKALKELEQLNEPLSTVIRNGNVMEVPTHEIAVGDLCITEEGRMINADGRIIHSNDFSVNESSLTGESLSVYKDKDSEYNKVYSGTLTVSGLAVFEVEKIGRQTRLGKIGVSVSAIKAESSPLQIQITKFVRGMAIAGLIIFLMVCGYRFYQTGEILGSLLNGLTMAMSVLPEEIPVAFTTFMALGAWKLMREGIIIKRGSVVETLGSTTVICTDKTGTITENSMQLKFLYDFGSDRLYEEKDFSDPLLATLIQYAMWSSEPVPFDPMEKSLHHIYEATQKDIRKDYRLFHEYPLEGKPPMMTHLFENSHKERIIAAKGAPEAILAVTDLPDNDRTKIKDLVASLGKKGYRILGVAKSDFNRMDFPEKQQDFPFAFIGLAAFYDPQKQGIREIFRQIYDAGIQVKIITGDNADTTQAIAGQAGISNTEPPVNGNDISHYSEKELAEVVGKTTLFTRMFPDAKLSVVNALKKKGEVVAMLGDGVNDAPALKAAHIGVAMGNKGTEIAKAAAALVITNDDLAKLVTGIAAGRRIYTNIKKAVQYIISIHIPIILTVSLPLFLGWLYPQIFTPVHVIFLELVMGPTCSIVYENEPIELNAMKQLPRVMTDTFLNWRELAISIIQGLVITAGILFVYQFMAQKGAGEEKTRAMVFTTLIFANILLSLANRSFYYSMISGFSYRNPLLVIVTILTLALLLIILFVTPVAEFFRVTRLNAGEMACAFLSASCSVLWFEVYKWIKRRKSRQ